MFTYLLTEFLRQHFCIFFVFKKCVRALGGGVEAVHSCARVFFSGEGGVTNAYAYAFVLY